MPFKSKAQRRKFYAMADRGEISKKTVKRWEDHTPKGKKLPEKVKEREKAAALRAVLKKKAAMAWLGRKAVMPGLAGIAGLFEKLVGKISTRGAGKLHDYGTRLRGYAATKPKTGLPAGVQEGIDKIIREQAMYGGAGAAAVGIPALAGVLGGVSGARRRKAERALAEAMEEKEASMSPATRLGFRTAFGKMAAPALREAIGMGAESLGRGVSPAIAKLLELVGAKGTGRSLRNAARHSKQMERAFEISDGGAPFQKITLPGYEKINEGILKSKKTMRGVGAGTAGVGAAGAGLAVGLPFVGKKKKKEKEKDGGEKKEAQLGTPMMDGFLIRCAKAGLSQKQTVDVLEKAAKQNSPVGKECKAFLERLANCDD